MVLFDFGGGLSSHFFKWISKGGLVDPNALIEQALKETETEDEQDGIEPPEAHGICMMTVRDKLADKLEEILQDQTPLDWPWEYSPVNETAESLWHPILADAVENINCRTVAEALLIQAGKLNFNIYDD